MSDAADMRVVFAGDRSIAVRVLDYLLEQGVRPVGLGVSESPRASHAEALRARCGHLGDERVFVGREIRTPESIETLAGLEPDLFLSIHFPYIVPDELLAVPRLGALNLHPAYLPYNRGWHTASWAILDGTPIGATLHFMDAGLDTGDIVHRKELPVGPADTADDLYPRLEELELEVFREAWPGLRAGQYDRTPQHPADGTAHRRQDLMTADVQRIDMDQPGSPRELLRRLRALTTSRIGEAAYFEEGGTRYRVRVQIEPDPNTESSS